MNYTKDNIQGLQFKAKGQYQENMIYLISKVAGEIVIISFEEEGRTIEVKYTLVESLYYLNSGIWVEIPGKIKTNAKLYLLLAFYGKEVTINKNATAVISGIKTYTQNSNTTLSHEDKDSTVTLLFKGYAVNYKLSEIEITPSPEDHTDLHITIKTN